MKAGIVAAVMLLAVPARFPLPGACAAEPGVEVTEDDLKNLEQKKAQPRQPNPLHSVADDMVKAQVRLKQGESGNDAQEPMVEAIRKLEMLIEIAQQQQQQSQNRADQQRERRQEQQQSESKPQNTQQQQQQQQHGTRPAANSNSGGTRGAEATGGEPEGRSGIEWGNLPPKMREEYDQILKEDFPEAYKRLLELYYKNLSDR